MLLLVSFLVNAVIAYTILTRLRWWACGCRTCAAMRRVIATAHKAKPALAGGTVIEFRKAPPAPRQAGIH